jgi:hypothetical protein
MDRAAQHQRDRRDRMRDRGRPDTVHVDVALVEAVSFLIAQQLVSTLNADANPDLKSMRETMALSVTELKRVTFDILCRRQGFDRAEARIALGHRLRVRDLRREPWHIPSLRPDPIAQQARIDAAAHERAKSSRTAA